MLGIVGGSGTGKSVLLRTLIGLQRPVSGHIEVLGRDILHLREAEQRELDQHFGVLFQDGALFSSLTVAQNIEVPLREHCPMPEALMAQIAATKIAMVGLPEEAGDKFPSQLSGGMRKRSGLARSLALDPEILFLDEPTAGLDPIAAAAFDRLIGDLKASLGLTVVMATHDLDTLFAICDRVAVLVDKKIRIGTLAEHLEDPHPWIRAISTARAGAPRLTAAASSIPLLTLVQISGRFGLRAQKRAYHMETRHIMSLLASSCWSWSRSASAACCGSPGPS